MNIAPSLLADTVIRTSDRNLGGITVASVVITGMAVVFIGLILLIFVVWLYGKIFEAIDKRREEKAAKDAPKTQPTEIASTPTENDTDEQTTAVIAAAIAAYGEQTGKTLVIKSIKPKHDCRRERSNAWSAAGLAENTRPF